MGKVLNLIGITEKLELKAGRRKWMYKGDAYPIKLVSDIEARGGFKGKGSQVILFLIDPKGKKVAKGMQGALSVKKVTDFIDKWKNKGFEPNQNADVNEDTHVDMEIEEAKLSSKDVAKMIKAIKDEDEKTLLKYMAMDKKNMFSQKNLQAQVQDGLLSKDDASKLGKLSIGVAHALDSINQRLPDKKKMKRAMAMDRVKEVGESSDFDEMFVVKGYDKKGKMVANGGASPDETKAKRLLALAKKEDKDLDWKIEVDKK